MSQRSPQRDKAFEIWRDSGGIAKLKDISSEIGVPDSRIRKWKALDKWDEKLKEKSVERSSTISGTLHCDNGSAPLKKRGAQPGNKNARGHGAPKGNSNGVGNRGGPGGPIGNKKAVTTGEYETIWFDCLTEEEQSLCGSINTDTLAQVEEDIRLITIRERRMMERIRKLMNGLTETERKVLQELHVEKKPIEVYDEKTRHSKVVVVPDPKMVTTEIRETEYRAIDDIIKQEEALTRVQEKKTRLLALKHEIEIENKNVEEQQLKLEKLRAEITKLKGGTGLGDSNQVQIIDDINGDNDVTS